MKWMRRVALVVLCASMLLALGAPLFSRASYDTQFREFPNHPPNAQFWLGTDDLGRDRYSRLLYGARVSFVFAPFAAALCVCVAMLVALGAGIRRGLLDRAATVTIDLCLGLPLLFVLLLGRALLPLDADPWLAAGVTFALLGVLGWAPAARVLRSRVTAIMQSDSALQAEAAGYGRVRLALLHVLPQMLPLAVSQFLIAIPIFLVAEANLGILGLGVPEPMPSIGNALSELANVSLVPRQPWLLVPVALVLAVLASLQIVIQSRHCDSTN